MATKTLVMMDEVVYRLGQRVETRLQRLRRFSLLIVSSTLIVAATGLYGGISQAKLTAARVVDGKQKHQMSASIRVKIIKGSAHPGTQSGAVAAATATASATTPVRSANCNLFGPLTPGLSGANSPELRKLAQYEQLCNGALVGRSSFFAPTPSTVAEAQTDAADMVSQLKEYASFGIKPLVFLEPDDGNGNNLDLVQYQAGAYDTALDSYFSDIKDAGVTDSMMGMWVIMPEGNLPEWGSVDPNVFAADVTKTVQFQKKYFPSSQASVMLDSETYPSANSWDNGSYSSLVPYVQNIPKGLLDSFGLQGFPWAAPADQGIRNNLYDPTVYLRVDLAAQAARVLGVSNIWFNTGTFHQMYAANPSETVTNSPAQRQAMLDGIVSQAKVLQTQGFTVEVHLFAQNKAATSEGTDWSYWQNQPSDDTQDSAVLATFVNDLTTANIPLWLFDTYDQ
jgi:hypothetical protein